VGSGCPKSVVFPRRSGAANRPVFPCELRVRASQSSLLGGERLGQRKPKS
jgi:hypothetical protein